MNHRFLNSEDLTPDERLQCVAELLAVACLRLIDEKAKRSAPAQPLQELADQAADSA